MRIEPSHAQADGPWSVASVASAVRSVLSENRVVRELIHVATVDSTQDTLRELAAAGASTGTAVITDWQRAGRGRTGNRWDDDPSGGNLAMSLLLDGGARTLHAMSVPLIPHALGLAVVEAAASVGPAASALRLKWPNDVVHRPSPEQPSRKLAGVLVERQRLVGVRGERDVLLCGIGVNIDLGEEVPSDRTDLRSALGGRPDQAVLLATLLKALDTSVLALASPASLLDRYRAVSDTIGRTVRVQVLGEEPLVGIAMGIDDDGRLLVNTGDRTHAILSGTVRDADLADDIRSDRRETDDA